MKNTLLFITVLLICIFANSTANSTPPGAEFSPCKIDRGGVPLSSQGCCSPPIVKIYDIQGSSDASPMQGRVVTTEGIVTETYFDTDAFDGYFIQDQSGDGNEQTSDGLFIYCGGDCPSVSPGDLIQVTGTVTEWEGLTELKDISDVRVLSRGNKIPSPTPFVLSTDNTQYERYESMLIQIDQHLTVTENHKTISNGQIRLSSIGVVIDPTQIIDPNDEDPNGNTYFGDSNVSAIDAEWHRIEYSTIQLDDGKEVWPEDIAPRFYWNKKIRVGSTLDQVVGILFYHYEEYLLEALSNTHPYKSHTIHYAPDPEAPNIKGDIIIVSMNVERFKFELSEWGAKNPEEYKRRSTKVVAAIVDMHPDIIAFQEMDLDARALESLVKDLNKALAPKPGYKILVDPFPYTGYHKNAIIYKPSNVSPVGQIDSITRLVYPTWGQRCLVQKFRSNTSIGIDFVVVATHLKSKGGCPDSGINTDQGDGQGCWNDMRKIQIRNIVKYLTKKQPGEKVIILGDYNTRTQEDPLDLFRSHGYEDVIKDTFSFVFIGRAGLIDHAFINKAFEPYIAQSAVWHVNSPEPFTSDFHDEYFKLFYRPDPYRYSDHDPLIIGINNNPMMNVQNAAQKGFVVMHSSLLDGELQLHNLSGQKLYFTIVNQLGQRIKSGQMNDIFLRIPVSHLPPGAYYLLVRSNERQQTEKFIIY